MQPYTFTETSPRKLGRLELCDWQGTHQENEPLVFRIDMPNRLLLYAYGLHLQLCLILNIPVMDPARAINRLQLV
jgi:hypothetical protein